MKDFKRPWGSGPRQPLAPRSEKEIKLSRQAKEWCVRVYTQFQDLEGHARGLTAPCMRCGEHIPWNLLVWEHPQHIQVHPDLKWDPMNWALTCEPCNEEKGSSDEEYRHENLLSWWGLAVQRDWMKSGRKWYYEPAPG